MNKQTYVNQLPEATQTKILDEITLHLIQFEGMATNTMEYKEAIENACNSRLCDLENVIDIEQYV